MKYEKLSTTGRRTEEYTVKVQVTDVDDVEKGFARITYAPETVTIRWVKYAADQDWSRPGFVLEGRRRRKDGSLGATVRDAYPRSLIAKAWLGEIAEEVKPS